MGLRRAGAPHAPLGQRVAGRPLRRARVRLLPRARPRRRLRVQGTMVAADDAAAAAPFVRGLRALRRGLDARPAVVRRPDPAGRQRLRQSGRGAARGRGPRLHAADAARARLDRAAAAGLPRERAFAARPPAPRRRARQDREGGTRMSAAPTDVFDLATLLAPVAPERPAGESLRYEGTHDRIRDARREDDPRLSQGIYQAEPKRADWAEVESLCLAALARSKDLQIAAWLLEAWLHRYGFAGAREGLRLLCELCENFWDDLHPALEPGGDAGARVAPV